MKRYLSYTQHLLPQHSLSTLMGRLAESRKVWLKNFLIKSFIKSYNVNMAEALIEDPESYPTFNSFFIRLLKPALRPMINDPQSIASPADGTVAQIGKINQQQLLQAKNFYFDLKTLCGNHEQVAANFTGGAFATIYLAPNNYHRVHMPVTGKLTKAIYVPGKLFSVNRITSEIIPNLYSRNERLVTLFDTEAGPMAVIFVGAMIVGNIQTVWMDKPCRADKAVTVDYKDGPTLEKGAELGHFNVGSTVILLFGKDQVEWLSTLKANSSIQFGQLLGYLQR